MRGLPGEPGDIGRARAQGDGNTVVHLPWYRVNIVVGTPDHVGWQCRVFFTAIYARVAGNSAAKRLFEGADFIFGFQQDPFHGHVINSQLLAGRYTGEVR